jgi:RNA polymerase sigma-70 factor, ECF subfamily
MESAVRKLVSRSAGEADPDGEDVAFAQDGDVEAFERLYRRHAARVNSLAEWMLDTAETEDVLQDIFIRAWEKIGTFRGQAAFGTWLHRLAVNVLIRHRRRTRLRDQRYVTDDGVSDATAGRWDGFHLRNEIESAVSALPRRMREVLVLHDMEGYKHREIARLLGISQGTSQWNLHAARERLRAYFE